MIIGKYTHRVLYSETDKMGFMHHSNYARMYENARWELFREKGISYKSVEDSAVLMPVIDMHINYGKPAYYDDLLEVVVKAELAGNTKIVFNHTTSNQFKQHINKAKIVLAFINESTKRPIRIPSSILDIFKNVICE